MPFTEVEFWRKRNPVSIWIHYLDLMFVLLRNRIDLLFCCIFWFSNVISFLLYFLLSLLPLSQLQYLYRGYKLAVREINHLTPFVLAIITSYHCDIYVQNVNELVKFPRRLKDKLHSDHKISFTFDIALCKLNCRLYHFLWAVPLPQLVFNCRNTSISHYFHIDRCFDFSFLSYESFKSVTRVQQKTLAW